jgi:hypothetical protein
MSQPMRICYLHCGPHKTGSTTLQHIMDEQPDLLLARKLFRPVLVRGRTSKSHTGLIPELKHLVRGDGPTPHWTALRTILSRTSLTPVLSSEIFSTHFLKTDELTAAIRFLRDCGMRPHFIYYLRDQPAWINSTYVQETKKFYTSLSFEDYLDQAYAKPRFDYSQMLGPLINNPDADLTVLPFEAAAQSGLFNSFLAAMKVAPCTPQELPDTRRDNPNAGVKSVYVGRRIAAILAAQGLEPRRHHYVYQQLKRHYTDQHWAADPYSGLDDALATKIRAQFAASNDRVAQALWGQDWASVMGPSVIGQRSFTRNEFDPATCLPAELAEVEQVIADLQGLIGFVAAFDPQAVGRAD